MQTNINWSFFIRYLSLTLLEVCERNVVYWSYYKSWNKLLINDSDKFIEKNLLYYKAYHIEASQSILTAYQLTGLHMKTSLYQKVMIAQLNFLSHEDLWLNISTTRIKKHLSRNPQNVETGQSIRTAKQVTGLHINRVRWN